MKTRTQWFDRHTNPEHVGFYEATAFGHYDWPPFCFWDGAQWLRADMTDVASIQDREWRGLAVKPKSGISSKS